jgi:hypothetical protein
MLATDCPYLTPHPHRGKRNSPLYLHLVAEKIAEIRGITPLEVAQAAYDNAFRFFRVPPDPVRPLSKKSGSKGGKSSKTAKTGKTTAKAKDKKKDK